MLHCTHIDAAMQTKPLWWHLVYIKSLLETTGWRLPPGNPRSQMSKTATIALSTPNTLFGRFLATLDQILMASANAAVRNGEPTYFGL